MVYSEHLDFQNSRLRREAFMPWQQPLITLKGVA
jgi:hypothetical protein